MGRKKVKVDEAELTRKHVFLYIRRTTRWLTKAFTLVGGAVHKHLCRDDVSEGNEHLQYLRVSELLWQVVDEDVAALWTWTQIEPRRHRHDKTSEASSVDCSGGASNSMCNNNNTLYLYSTFLDHQRCFSWLENHEFEVLSRNSWTFLEMHLFVFPSCNWTTSINLSPHSLYIHFIIEFFQDGQMCNSVDIIIIIIIIMMIMYRK